MTGKDRSSDVALVLVIAAFFGIMGTLAWILFDKLK